MQDKTLVDILRQEIQAGLIGAANPDALAKLSESGQAPLFALAAELDARWELFNDANKERVRSHNELCAEVRALTSRVEALEGASHHHTWKVMDPRYGTPPPDTERAKLVERVGAACMTISPRMWRVDICRSIPNEFQLDMTPRFTEIAAAIDALLAHDTKVDKS